MFEKVYFLINEIGMCTLKDVVDLAYVSIIKRCSALSSIFAIEDPHGDISANFVVNIPTELLVAALQKARKGSVIDLTTFFFYLALRLPYTERDILHLWG